MKGKGFTGNSPSLMNLFAVDEQSSKHEQIIPTFEGGGAICRSGGLQGSIPRFTYASWQFSAFSFLLPISLSQVVPPFLKSR